MKDEMLNWLQSEKMPERHKLAATMRANGAKLREIAEALEVHPARAGQICTLVKRKFERRHEVEARRQRAEALRRQAEEQANEQRAKRQNDWRRLTADDLELSVRASNVLRNACLDRSRDGAGTLGDLADMTDAELLRVPNCGWKTIRELREVQLEFAPDSYSPSSLRLEREIKREAGLVLVQVWVPKDDVGELQTFAHGLRLMHEEDQSALPSVADVRGIMRA